LKNKVSIPEGLSDKFSKAESAFVIKSICNVITSNVKGRKVYVDISGLGVLRTHGKIKSSKEINSKKKDRKGNKKKKLKAEMSAKKLLF